ncbi:unnamed protein product [Cercopithifilaria johnstoni]|uniref:PH domain containing protein n=1 Tax=Cercopithifilaria johnstoni TaxID=2874296 RepID=A0A8J2MIV1_9BILA|nr:unnamed protein product [Cercopithifilaria johnstoni]
MREADIKKIYVKFFIDDGSSTISLLIDERWTVAECIRRIAMKLSVPLSEHHAIVEEYPDLYIKRIYEDHEYLVENIMMWTLNSQNKLYFTRRLDKYSFLDRPEEFLVTQKNIDTLMHGPPSPNTKRHVIREFFDGDNVQPPEKEGWLFLKSDGKKSWKKYFFVLRLSGLYYCPKGKSRNSKDLQCLMNMQTNQVYTAIDWKKKYKAPSNYGFAIKHPKIQVKASKYIKYVCTEDALTFHKWMVALRIAKNGQNLYENYIEMKKQQQQTESNAVIQPVKVGIPQISLVDSNRVSFVEMRKSNIQQCQQQDPSPLLNLNHDLRTPISSRLSTGISNDGNSSPRQNSIIFDQCDDIITGTIKRAPCDIMLGSRQSTMNDYRGSSDGIASPSGRSGGTAESDSDEEQFPPPPPIVVATISHGEDSRDVYSNQDDTPPVVVPSSKTTFSQQQQPSTNHMAITRYHNGISSAHANNNGNYVPNMKPIMAPVPPTKPQFVIKNGRNSNQMICTENGITTGNNHHQLGTFPSQTSLTSLPKKIPPPPPPKRSDATKLQSTNAEALHSELEIAMARRLQKIGQL